MNFRAALCLALFSFFFFGAPMVFGGEIGLEQYVKSFDYKERARMKIKADEALELIEKGDAVLLDIRFPEEVALWKMSFGKTIPLNQLPTRLAELPKDKLIITACPHYDRAEIAMLYLTLKGYRARYLVEGLLGLAEKLRGDVARDVYEALNKK